MCHNFKSIVSLEKIYQRKKRQKNVQEFSLRLMDNIISLYSNLNNHTYRHDGYQVFNISDPKLRNIKKFFANIDHKVLLDILDSYIPDKRIIWLLKEIIESFSVKPGVGLPLGNLTSQLFVNIYMNGFDQFLEFRC